MEASQQTGSPCVIAEWDTEFFGFTIARTTIERPVASDVDRILAWCADRDVRCLYHLADPRDTASLAAVAARGFELMDVRMEFEAPTGVPRQGLEMPDGYAVRPAKEEDFPVLFPLARAAFTDSRFVRDERFPRERVAEMYERWLVRSHERGAVLVVERDGIPRGFVACERDGDAVRAQLLGLAPEARGKGIGPALFTEVLRWGRENGLPTMLSAASATNISSVRMHETDGLRTCAVSLWYHRWFPKTDRRREA